MTACDMCGSHRPLVVASIEGTRLHVCSSCASYGKVLSSAPSPAQHLPTQRPRQRTDTDMDQILVADFAHLIKQAREQQGLHQKDLAHALKEKESVLHKIESGHLRPSLALANKLERFLHITLVQTYAPPGKLTSSQDGTLTIGDLVKIRKKP